MIPQSPASNCPLAIFTPILGRQAQTFVKAHIDRILPGRTFVIAVGAFEPTGPCWSVDAPLLFVPPRLHPSQYQPDASLTMLETIPAEQRRRFATEQHTQHIEDSLRERNVEVILAQWLDESLPLLDMARNLGIRYHCQSHGTDISAGLRDEHIQRAYAQYNHIDGVVAPSEFGRQQLLQIGLQPEKVHVIRHAVRVPVRPVARPQDVVHCLAVGRMTSMKGSLVLVDAFCRALESCPELRLDYVGDGVQRTEVEQVVRDLGLKDRVTLYGFLSNDRVIQLMRRCHILVHPSQDVGVHRYDTCPVTVTEAMAQGMAIVATRHGGIPEQIIDGESGLLVAEGDVQAIAEQIVLLAGDPQLRQWLGAAAWRRAQEMFDEAVVYPRWHDLLGLG